LKETKIYIYTVKSTLATHRADILDHENVDSDTAEYVFPIRNVRSMRRIGHTYYDYGEDKRTARKRTRINVGESSDEYNKSRDLIVPTDDVIKRYEKKRHTNL